MLPSYTRYFKFFALSLAAAFAFVQSSCTPTPQAIEISETIVQHFESRGYKVKKIKINAIAPVEISEKTYMGTPGFRVSISKITLTGRDGRREFVFTDAVITIRESRNNRARWSIIDIKGISLI